MLFFPLKLGHDPTLTKLLFSRFFSPHSRNYDLKSLMQVAYGHIFLASELKFCECFVSPGSFVPSALSMMKSSGSPDGCVLLACRSRSV